MTPRFILGTAGHIDHGKTALIRALTGVDTDRLPDEKRRGITIDLGFARLPVDDGVEFGVVDVPGHEGFIRNMVAGATGIDVVLLVIAADEGVMPQTREHLAIVELLGVRTGVVAVTKTDLVEPEWLELVLADVREQLGGTPLADAPILPVSSETGDGVERVRRVLAETAQGVEQRGTDDLFRLPIDRVFTVRGTGTVVTGTIWSGRLSGDAVPRVLPADREVRIRGIQVHGRDRDAARAGERTAVALVGAERDELSRGDVLVTGADWRAHRMLTVRLRILPGTEWTVEPRQRIRLHLGTAEVMARVVPLNAGELLPGDEAWAQLRLEAPIVARAGDPFVIRSYSPITTIGGGRVAEPVPEKRRSLTEPAAERLAAVLDGSVDDAVAARVDAAGWLGVSVAALSVATPGSPAAVARAVDRLEPDALIRLDGRAFARATVDAARARILAAVDDHHVRLPLKPGMDREEVRRAVPDFAPAGLSDRVLQKLVAKDALEQRGSLVARTGFAPRLTADQSEARRALLESYRQAGLAPPSASELPAALADRSDLDAMLQLMAYEGDLVAVAEDRFVARDVMDRAIRELRDELAGRESLTPADFRAVFAVSRKHLIPLLEYFDRVGVTARRGDVRTVAAVD